MDPPKEELRNSTFNLSFKIFREKSRVSYLNKECEKTNFGLLLDRSEILVKIQDSCSYQIVPLKKNIFIAFVLNLILQSFYSVVKPKAAVRRCSTNYNHGHKILRHFDILANFPLTTSVTKRDY